jgi:hypothetical protein
MSTLQIVGIVIGGVVAVIVALIILGAIVAGNTVDQGELEDEISQGAAQFGPVEEVSCPDDVKQEVGETFSCSINFSDATTGTANGHVTSTEGEDAEFEYTVTKG